MQLNRTYLTSCAIEFLFDCIELKRCSSASIFTITAYFYLRTIKSYSVSVNQRITLKKAPFSASILLSRHRNFVTKIEMLYNFCNECVSVPLFLYGFFSLSLSSSRSDCVGIIMRAYAEIRWPFCLILDAIIAMLLARVNKYIGGFGWGHGGTCPHQTVLCVLWRNPVR